MTDENLVVRPGSDRQPPQGRTSDFSRIAFRYDATRDLPEDRLTACYDRLIEHGVFPASGRILDAGCGTGQVSLPLAARGYEVLGIDISKEMTAVANSKVRPGWRANYSVDDVRGISAGNASFDAVVVSKLFQHVQDWREACLELIRVVRPGRCIVQINERGVFSNAVRRFFSQKADDLGFGGRYAGLNPHSEGELAAFMKTQGCQPLGIDVADLRWDTSISYGEALNRIREGLFAEFWYLPKDIHHKLIAGTQRWIDAHPEGERTVQHLKPYLRVEVFQTPSAG